MTATTAAPPRTLSPLGALVLDDPHPNLYAGHVAVYPATVDGQAVTRIRVGGLAVTATVWPRDGLTGTFRVALVDALHEPGYRAVVDTQLRGVSQRTAWTVAESLLRGLAAEYGVAIVAEA
jgi:hypothetical protein